MPQVKNFCGNEGRPQHCELPFLLFARSVWVPYCPLLTRDLFNKESTIVVFAHV